MASAGTHMSMRVSSRWHVSHFVAASLLSRVCRDNCNIAVLCDSSLHMVRRVRSAESRCGDLIELSTLGERVGCIGV